MRCRIVAHADNDGLEDRTACNTAKHDEESNTVRWSTLYQKLSTAAARFKKLGDWSKVSSSLLELYGPSKKATVGRWVRAARGIPVEVLREFKTQPDLKGPCLWDNPIHHLHGQPSPQPADTCLRGQGLGCLEGEVGLV